jgi:hypothetical protein
MIIDDLICLVPVHCHRDLFCTCPCPSLGKLRIGVQIQKRWDTAAVLGTGREHYALLDMWIGGASPARLGGGSLVVSQDIPTENIH